MRVVRDRDGFVVIVGNECYAVRRVYVNGTPLKEPSAEFEARRVRLRLWGDSECLIVTGGGK